MNRRPRRGLREGRRLRRMRPVFVLPNLFTSASLFAALCSIIATSNDNYTHACYLILLSAVFDALDGPIARLTRSTSSFGLQYDSLADLVAFGVAPSFLMYKKLESFEATIELPPYGPRMAIGVCALFAICGAIRLARFNIQADDEEKLHFTGLPIPAAATMVVSTFLVIEDYLTASRGIHRIALIEMVMLSYLMVCTIPFASLKGIYRRTQKSVNGLVTVVFTTCLLIAFREVLPLVVFLAMLCYLGASLLHAIRMRRRFGTYSPGAVITFEAGEPDETGEES